MNLPAIDDDVWELHDGSSDYSGVQLDLGVDDHDHFIDPDERFRIAMARQ